MRKGQLSIERQARLVRCAEHPHVLALLAPSAPRRLAGIERHFALLAEAAHALGRVDGVLQGIPNRDRVTRTLARREAVESSQIEGTRSDLPQLLLYEATRGMDGLPTDVKITERYVQALQSGLDAIRTGGRRALTLDLVNQLHATLMQDAPADFPAGRYRPGQVWIGAGRIEDAIFVPTPSSYLEQAMGEFERDVLQYRPKEDEQTELPVISQVAIAHAQFQTIHPYQDGNGRTGRLLMPLLLAAEGHPPLYLSGHLLRHKQAYYDSLASVQLRGDWGAWIHLLARAIIASCGDAIAIARDLATIQASWEHQVRTSRADSVLHRLPAFLIGHPVVTVRQIAENLGVSIPVANQAAARLKNAGILEDVDAQRKWGRVFRAREVLERLDRPAPM